MSLLGFPGSSAGKESICKAGDPSLTPGLGRSPGEGIGYPFQYSWASLLAQTVKNLPAMQETWVGKIPWRRSRQPNLVFLPGESSWREKPGGLQSMGSQRVGHNWMTKHNTHVCVISLNKMPWEEGNSRTGKANISSKRNPFCFIYFPRILTCCFKIFLF